jgi:hypothetical protein
MLPGKVVTKYEFLRELMFDQIGSVSDAIMIQVLLQSYICSFTAAAMAVLRQYQFIQVVHAPPAPVCIPIYSYIILLVAMQLV